MNERQKLVDWKTKQVKHRPSVTVNKQLLHVVQPYKVIQPMLLHQTMTDGTTHLSRLDVALGIMNYFLSNKLNYLYGDAVDDATLKAKTFTIATYTASSPTLDQWLTNYFGVDFDGFIGRMQMLHQQLTNPSSLPFADIEGTESNSQIPQSRTDFILSELWSGPINPENDFDYKTDLDTNVYRKYLLDWMFLEISYSLGPDIFTKIRKQLEYFNWEKEKPIRYNPALPETWEMGIVQDQGFFNIGSTALSLKDWDNTLPVLEFLDLPIASSAYKMTKLLNTRIKFPFQKDTYINWDIIPGVHLAGTTDTSNGLVDLALDMEKFINGTTQYGYTYRQAYMILNKYLNSFSVPKVKKIVKGHTPPEHVRLSLDDVGKVYDDPKLSAIWKNVLANALHFVDIVDVLIEYWPVINIVFENHSASLNGLQGSGQYRNSVLRTVDIIDPNDRHVGYFMLNFQDDLDPADAARVIYFIYNALFPTEIVSPVGGFLWAGDGQGSDDDTNIVSAIYTINGYFDEYGLFTHVVPGGYTISNKCWFQITQQTSADDNPYNVPFIQALKDFSKYNYADGLYLSEDYDGAAIHAQLSNGGFPDSGETILHKTMQIAGNTVSDSYGIQLVDSEFAVIYKPWSLSDLAPTAPADPNRIIMSSHQNLITIGREKLNSVEMFLSVADKWWMHKPPEVKVETIDDIADQENQSEEVKTEQAKEPEKEINNDTQASGEGGVDESED